ncbi:MAG: hypothetical protein HWQ35_24030 [Nostoc sp. NMS1]|uniref:hypothetical protein n=1 Tax=unclassified Nostoc TaxID=2593658 RepID=UPI0025F83A9A|nr:MULTISPECIES: hypothetical protein [unclassified Nostoc]MBN3909499.1 hypothetical protein [Nostoc sp. NMS1]MBN3994107.1 hypothetical protein [Nostoc sp. NMS2]
MGKLGEHKTLTQYLRQIEKCLDSWVGLRHETQQIRWVLLRSTQPTKNGEGIAHYKPFIETIGSKTGLRPATKTAF